MRRNVVLRSSMVAAVAALLGACSLSGTDRAALDTGIGQALEQCKSLPECNEGKERAYGMLVLPGVSKGALLLGGAYGEGGLVENGKTTGYYSFVGSSLGLQLGYRERTMVLTFLTPSALARFKDVSGWDFRRNLAVSAGKSGDDWEGVSATAVGLIDGAPAYVFILDEDGLMLDASWNAIKINHMTVEP